MIVVQSYSNDRPVDQADADDPRGAVTAARALWDEAFNGLQGQRRALTFTVDGALVRRLEVRPLRCSCWKPPRCLRSWTL